MTPQELDVAIKAAGLGWGITGEITTADAAGSTERCNIPSCKGYTMLANEVGLTTPEFVPTIVSLAGDPIADPPVLPDTAALNTHRAARKVMRAALVARALSWSCDGGVILVWSAGDRSTEISPQWEGATVTTQAYSAQATTAGATVDDMADALADLVAGDSTAFDAIMSA